MREPSTESAYSSWLDDRRCPADRLQRQREVETEQRGGPTVCVVVGHGSLAAQRATFSSLETQSWPHWRATFLVPPGTSDDRLPVAPDNHRSFIARSEPHVEATNHIVLSGGRPRDLLILLDAGDLLEPDSLHALVAAAHMDPLIDLVVADSDIVGPGGVTRSPRFRPSWSPEALLSACYVERACAMRVGRFILAGGLRAEAGPWALWDLVLRCDFDSDRVARVPRVLFHLAGTRQGVDATAVDVIGDLLARKGWDAEAAPVDGAIRIRWRDDHRRVSVIVPTRHNRPLMTTLLDGLARTDYAPFEVIVVDNGERSAVNEAWYERWRDRLDLTILWWDTPFNYSAVNNLGARHATGDVLVFLNDDIEVLDPGWLRQLTGWTRSDRIGCVGMQLVDPDGRIQHGGVVVGMSGFADHLFGGAAPGSDSLFGPTTWYRNCLAVTGACMAVRHEVFDRLGGFDERFLLCGSDVALGLVAHLAGLRNLCIPDNSLRHLESATRGPAVPEVDYHVSYWRYSTWLHGGDPYFSPNLSLDHRIPSLRPRGEDSSLAVISRVIGRPFMAANPRAELDWAESYALECRASRSVLDSVRRGHLENREPFTVHTVNWYVPGLDSPFYGGINTALRIADHLRRDHDVENRFIVSGMGPEAFLRAGIGAAFPALEGSPIMMVEDRVLLDAAPDADIDIATLWTTAYSVARHRGARRRFYLVQDFEPAFYPAGTIYALAEASYRLGLYGICNTDHLADIYRNRYGGIGRSFTPAVDTTIFHARTRPPRDPDAPVTVFVYARPGHWRNCWELANSALIELKERLGDDVRIVAAGSWAIPDEQDHLPAVKFLGLLDYRATGELYRHSDVGLALTVSEHPSYLPLEMMACGATVVAFDNPAGRWLLRPEENCVVADRTVDSLADALERVATNPPLRRRLSEQALQDIASRHGDWDSALSGIYEYLCDPEGLGAGPDPERTGQSHRLLTVDAS